MKAGILLGFRCVGGMERAAVCWAKVLVELGVETWAFQNNRWFGPPEPWNDPVPWFTDLGLEVTLEEADALDRLTDTDVVYLFQPAQLSHDLYPYINAVPYVCEVSGVTPTALNPHEGLMVDRFIAFGGEQEIAKQAEARGEPIDSFWEGYGTPVHIRSGPVEVRDREQVVFGCVSRQDHFKALHYLIEAFRGIDGPHKLILVGDGPDGVALRQLAEGDKRIEFPGSVSDRDVVEEWFGSLDVYAMSSNWEGSSQSIREALQFGLPCIVSDGGGTPFLVGDAALVIPVGDVSGIRSAMMSMMDPDARRDWSARSLARACYIVEAGAGVIERTAIEARTRPRVSIVTAVGPKHRELVDEAVQSVASCEFGMPLEMILVDDGAGIDIGRLSKHNFIRILRLVEQSGGRPGLVRNVGALASSSKLLLFLDADDLILPGALGALYQSWRKDPTGVKYGGVIKETAPGQCEYLMSNAMTPELARKGGVHSVSTLLHRCVWECIGGFPEDNIGFEDSRFFAVADTIFGAKRVPVYVIVYRHYTGERWKADLKRRAEIQEMPEPRAEYYTWIENKLEEVYVNMANCKGCSGRAGNNPRRRGAGIVAGSNPSVDGALSGMSEEVVALEYTGEDTRYHVDSKAMPGRVHYRFSSKRRDKVKYVLEGDAGWMLETGIFKRHTPPVEVGVQPQPVKATRIEPARAEEIVIVKPFSGPLGKLDLAPEVKAILIAEGLDTVEKIRGATIEQLTSIGGVGRKTVKQIREALSAGDDSDRPGDVEADEPVSTRKRPVRPIPEAEETGRRTRPRRRSGG